VSERFQAEGFTFERSGPWPPYSFCDDEGTDQPDIDAEIVSEEEGA
jgi:hypothetical protein